MSEEEPKTLRALFTTAERLRNDIAASYDSNSPTHQENLATAITTYDSCLTLAEQVSLFSPNESLDDVSSSDIQYMSISFHLAELAQRIRISSIAERKTNLLRARDYYERFVKLLDSYDVLGKSDAKLWEAYLENKDQFSTASTRDAAARRDAKIQRFREEKELKKKLEYINQNPRLAENDDQVVRDLHLTNLAFHIHQTFAALESMSQELQIISLAPPAPPTNPSAPSQDTRESDRNETAYSERLDSQLPGLKYTGPILSPSGKPLRPFTMLDTRQRLQQGVFRPDHSLPTMTIDEYLEEEKRRGGMIDGGGEQSGVRELLDEDDHDKMDEETMKARAWDEYVEENPKGSGNTLNRG